MELATGREAPREISHGRVRHGRVTLSRVVALALIAVLVVTLAYIRLAAEPEPIAVPDGAKAGDLVLEPCEYAGEGGSVPAECGTLVVRERPLDPASRLIALPVVRVLSASENPKEPVFYLTGGPGQSNMEFDLGDRYTADRDFVLVGYRGIDGSARLDCPEVASATKRSTDLLSDDYFRAYADGYRSCAKRLTGEGFDLGSYGLVQQVDDMEAARVALGYERVDLLSDSAGTRTAMIYAWRHPEAIHRSVMVAVNPPGGLLWDAELTDEQIDRFARLCAADGACRARTDDLAGTMASVADDVPDRWLFLPIKEGNARTIALFGLMDTAPTGPATAPVMIDAWLSAAEGDTSGLWLSAVLADVMFPELFVLGQRASAAMLDEQPAREYFRNGPGDMSNLGRAATASGWGGGSMVDAWPSAAEEEQYRRVRPSAVETLLVSGELDVATPPQLASNDLLPYLPNGEEVVLQGFGHVNDIFGLQPEASTRLINSFLDTGRADASLFEPRTLEFTPEQTFGAMAKTILGILLALAALAVLSLAVMARRVRKRGSIGRKSGVVLRSVYAVVLGLGGWCLGALVVLTTMPAVRIDNQLVAVLCIGVPTALGVYLAWVDQRWSPRSRRAGLLTATAGALVGAWLGYNAADDLISLATGVAGAVAGCNLTLILHDMWRTRPPATPPQPASLDDPRATAPEPSRAGATGSRRHVTNVGGAE